MTDEIYGPVQLPRVKISGRTRYLYTNQKTYNRPTITPSTGYTYYKAKSRRVAKSNAIGADTLKRGLVTTAERYGTPQQADKIRAIPVNQLQWMYDNGYLDTESIFEYSEETISLITNAPIADSKIPDIDQLITTHDELMRVGRAERQARRKARGWH